MKLALSLLLASALVPAAAQAANGRLDRNVRPLAYDIQVKPDAKALTFSGSETVTVDVAQPTRTLTLNAADLQVTSAALDGAPATAVVDNKAQLLTLTLARPVAAGRHRLTFAWTGQINKSAQGLFAIDYTNTDGSPDRMLATQFEAPDARRFAPMWDEPSFKATYTLSTTAPTGQLAFSNMPVDRVDKGAGVTTWHFRTTPVMSSYLLFLGMGDLERRTVQAGNVEIGVISRRGVSAQGDYALGQAKRLLSYYNSYFGQPYPLPKLDMIAGPGSSQFFGAMENWGAIFYFEKELLFDPARATESNRQRIYTVVAHEMAHQWFGDLVTMDWWDDIWLNEGFASWMENKSSRDLNPTWEAGATAVAFDREGALGVDATAATHPIVRHVETVDEIGEAFDAITYAKGQAVIAMMEATLGPDRFRDGIRRYMARYRYGNTVSDQLWGELATVAPGVPVRDIAHDFTLQPGVPLVTLKHAECVGGVTRAMLTQGRFGLDAASKTPERWHVPMTIGVVGGAQTKTVVFGPDPVEVTIPGCGAVLLNVGKATYAHVKYDGADGAALARYYPLLSLSDRLGTLADDYALAWSGDEDLSLYLGKLAQVAPDANPLEWSLVTGELGGLTGLYRGTPLEQSLRPRQLAVLSPVFARVGFEARAGEPTLATNLREELLGRLGASGDPVIAARARALVARLATDPTAIPPAIRAPILSTYAVNATFAEWDALLRLTEAEKSPVARNSFVALLGAARDPALATRALGLLETNRITDPQKASLLRSVADRHPDQAFDWAVAHRALVDSFLEQSSRADYIPRLAEGSNDPAMPGKIKAYAATLPAGSGNGAGRALAEIAVRRAAADRLRPAITAWVGQGAQ